MSSPADTKLRVLDIIDGTIVDGPGLRTSVYLAGCAHRCPGCQNPQSWDFSAGHDMTLEQLVEHVRYNDFNVTFSGGDPLYQLDALIEASRAIRTLGKTVWCYTGYTLEEIEADSSLCRILDEVDVLVEGRYVEDLRDISLRFRGSKNQRIIKLPERTIYEE